MSKITKQEAGKLGGQKWAEVCALNRAEEETAYNLSPKRCICGEAISFRNREINNFCSRKCSAINRKRTTKKHKCLVCPKEIHLNKKYCCRACAREGVYQTKTLPAIEAGQISDRNTLKGHLTRLHGYKCMCCDLSEWRGIRLSLELDHKDGNATNNSISNLQMICPNCHSITDNWKGRNMGKGRKSRGLPLS